MAVTVSVKGDVTESIKYLNRVERKYIPQAVSSSLNKTIKNVRAAANREIRQHVRLPLKIVKTQLSIKQASKVKWFTKLTAKAEDISLIFFKPREVWAKGGKKRVNRFGARMKSVKVQVKPRTKARVITRGFFGYSKKAVLQRKEGVARGPIKKLFGPSIDHRFDMPSTRKIMGARAVEQFPKNFNAQIQRILNRRSA
mgnify:CR=1 FL=1